MNLGNRDKLFSTGCLLVSISMCIFTYLCTLGYLTLETHWKYPVAVAALISVWMIIRHIGMWRGHRRRRHLELLEAAFAQSGQSAPQLKDGGSYGFPSFTLIFPSEAELRQAQESGCIAAFKNAIQSLYGHMGNKQNPFDAERAVWATYKGWKPHFTA